MLIDMRWIWAAALAGVCGCGGNVALDCSEEELRAWEGAPVGPIGAAAADAPAFDVWIATTVEADGEVEEVTVGLAGSEFGCERPEALDVALWAGPWADPAPLAERVDVRGAWSRDLGGGFEEVLLPVRPRWLSGPVHVAVRLSSGVTCGAAVEGQSMRWAVGAWSVVNKGAALGVVSCER